MGRKPKSAPAATKVPKPKAKPEKAKTPKPKKAATPPAELPTQLQQELDDLIRDGQKEQTAYATGEENATKRLYAALDATFQIYVKVKDVPEREYHNYLRSRLGKITLATTNSPFVAPLRLIFGNKDNSSHRARYSLALQEVARRTADKQVNPGEVAELIQKVDGKIDGLVVAAKQNKAATKGALPNYGYTDQEAVLRSIPITSFPLEGQPGLRVLLVNVSDGVASVLGEANGQVDAVVEAAARDRYGRMAPIPYVGSKHRQLRVIDKFLPDKISEYREPFVGGGAAFLFIKKTRPHKKIHYWINDKTPSVFFFWKQIKEDPELFLRQAQKIIDSAGGDFDKGKEIKRELEPIINGDNQLESSAAYFVSKMWSYGHKDEASAMARDKFRTKFDSVFKRILATSPLLQDVKITNLDYKDVLEAPPAAGSSNSGVLVFLDPPYDDQEHFYKSVLGARTLERPANMTLSQWKDLRWQEWYEGHLDLSIRTSKSPYKWIMTHSASKNFDVRTFVMMATKNNPDFVVYEHVVQSSFRNKDQKEVILANFKADEPSFLEKWHLAQYDIDPNDPIDWAEVARQIVAGKGEAPPRPSLVIKTNLMNPDIEKIWEEKSGGTPKEVAARIKKESLEAYYLEHPDERPT